MATDVQDAVDFVEECTAADSDSRGLALTDLKFRYGDQWPQYAITSRGLDRPQLTINEVDSYVRQVTNAQRQQRPRIKVHPVDDLADPKIAKVTTGLTRHIEVNSDADYAYDTGFDFAASIGFGYWRVRADYVSETTFDQDIYIDVLNNPFGVYFDKNSQLPDGSDADGAVVATWMRKKTFKKQYKDAECHDFDARGAGDSDPDWETEDEIRIGEYYHVDRTAAKLIMLSDGTLLWDDQMPSAAVLAQAGITVRGERNSFKRKVILTKQTAYEVLEENDLPGRWVPVVPVYWTRVLIDGKWMTQGLVRPAMDPQRMVNFWQTSITESIALAPKAKWLIAEGQDEGHENEFRNANLSASPVLRYKMTDVAGNPAPPPQRVQPEPPPSGAIEASFLASENLQRVMGMFDPAVRGQQTKSGKAVIAERSQAENSNFHGYDNLTRSIKHTGRIILSYIPVIYDTKRVMRIIGEDGRPELVTLNEPAPAMDENGQPQMDETGQAIQKVLNDVTVGQYDVVMDTGPGYDTKRIEGVDAMMQLMNTPVGEKVAQVGDDLLVRQMDFPGADVLADRLAAANPMAQVDEKSEIPAKIQMQIKGLQRHLQQAQQIIQQQAQEIKFKAGIADAKNKTDIAVAHMKATVDAHDTETWAAQDSKESLADNQTKVLVEEMKGHIALLLARIDERSADKARADADMSAVN